MRAPATARCWRRARRSTSWRCATARILPATTQAAALGETTDDQRRLRHLPSGRPCARLGADRGRASAACASSPPATTSARPDATCAPFEPIKCDVFITEATFGLPVFRHPPDTRRDRPAAEIGRAVSRARASGRRLCARQGAARDPAAARRRLRQADLHPRRAGQALRLLSEPGHRSRRPAAGDRRERRARQDFAGAIVVGPPSAFADRWARRFPDPISCFASGWMRIRQRAKQGGVELPLIISDHSDWDELTDTIRRDRRRRSLGHAWPRGGAGALVRARRHRRAPLHLVGYEDEGD